VHQKVSLALAAEWTEGFLLWNARPIFTGLFISAFLPLICLLFYTCRQADIAV